MVLKRTKMAVLVELEFINSDTDNQLFDENDAIALAIAEGILDTLMQNPVDMDSIPDVMPELTPEVEPEEAPPRYHIQVGAFRNMEMPNG